MAAFAAADDVVVVAESFSCFSFSMHFPLVVNALSSAATAAAAKVDNSNSSNNIISCPAKTRERVHFAAVVIPCN